MEKVNYSVEEINTTVKEENTTVVNGVPSSFNIAGINWKVVYVQRLEVDGEELLGLFSGVQQTIFLALTATNHITKEEVTLSESVILNTFYHELMHCFQWLAGDEMSETKAQVYANFYMEFNMSKMYE